MNARQKRLRKVANDFALKPVKRSQGDRGACVFCSCRILKYDLYRTYGSSETHDICVQAVWNEYKSLAQGGGQCSCGGVNHGIGFGI